MVTHLVRGALAPAPPSREQALSRMERVAALTHLVSSAEYLARPADRRHGGLNNWAIGRRLFHAKFPRLSRPIDVIADRRVTTALHVGRVVTAVAMWAPLPRRARGVADAVLATTSAASYPRHHYGTDGSDQVSFLVIAAATCARAGQRRPQVVDACLWFVALQGVLSYAVSGWVKLAGRSWRAGSALTGVMRTLTYGDPRAWRLFSAHQATARALGAGVLAMECLFPIVFVGRGRLAAPMLAGATVFHLANARLMGLGRFVTSFGSMHPAIRYAAAPVERRVDGRVVQRRDDTLPATCAGLVAVALAGALVAQARRRSIVLAGQGDEERFATRAGNVLTFRRAGPDDGRSPVLVLEPALLSTAEHWHWILGRVARDVHVVSYSRAGYGASLYGRRGPFRLEAAVDDLLELLEHVAPGRDVVLAGHSLGGWLAVLGAARAPQRVRGVCLIDSSHPAEMQRSSRQGQGQQMLSDSLVLIPTSLSLGLGVLLDRPEWADRLPAAVRRLALAQYRDPRLWRAGLREWRATVEAFDAFEGPLPQLDAPLLVLTAGFTAAHDAVQEELHREMAAMSPRSEHLVIERADHDQVLMDERVAARVGELLVPFATRAGRDRAREIHAAPAR